MKHYRLFFALLIAALPTTHAQATSVENILFSGSISATTDNRHRGISQSDGKPSIKGNVRLDHETGIYGSLDAASVKYKTLDPDAHVQTVIKAGLKGTYHNIIDYDGYISYSALPGGDNSKMDYWEIGAIGGYDFQAFYGSVTWALSPNYINGSGLTMYYAGDLTYPITPEWSLGAHMGFLFMGRDKKYADDYVMDYKLGVQYNLLDYDARVNLDYIGTNRHNRECRAKCDNRAVLSASKSFNLFP